MAPSSDREAFPVKQLCVLAICRISEPIAFMSIVAYSFAMVQDIKGDQNAPFYSNVLISAFALAEASTTMFWGTVSDKYGRKPVILLGLAGTALSSLLFGFAKTYWFALFARIVGGALNGNVAVMQTMIAEVVTNPEHEPRAYAVHPFMWNLGSALGSALGGFAAQPAKFYPDIFSPNGIFGRFPYLLPNLISVVVFVIAIVQSYFLLEETHVPGSKQDKIDETSPLIRNKRRSQSFRDISTPKVRRSSMIAGSTPIPSQFNFDIHRASSEPVDAANIDKTSNVEIALEDEDENRQIKTFTKPVILWIIALVLMGCHQVAFGAMLPVYLLDEPHSKAMQLDLVGGLGLTLHDVGTFLAITSFISLIVQGVFFPIYVAWSGAWKAALSLTVFCPMIYAVMPFISLMPDPKLGVYIVLCFQCFATIIIYPCLLILLKNATASPTVLGRVNGLAMAACSAARTIFPPLIGIIYGRFGSAGVWWSCSVVATIALIELFFIPRATPKDHKNVMAEASSD